MPEKPRPPIIPRNDSGTMRAVADESVGQIISIPPPQIDPEVDRRLRQLEDGHGSRIKTLEDEFRGQKAGLEQHIKTTVESSVKAAVAESVQSEIGKVTTTLGHQNAEMIRQGGLLTEVLEIVSGQQKATQKKIRDSLHDKSTELDFVQKQQKVADGKQRTYRLWIRAVAVVVMILGALGSAAGVSRCEHVKLELPE